MELCRRGRLSGDEIAEFFNARRALVEHEAAFGKAWDESGFSKAEDAFGEKNTAYFDAEMAALATRPTTFAGALALLAFVAAHLDTTDGDALLQLTRDVAERMEAVHAAFAEEYDLRFAEKGSA